jgi:hypothetical protein
MTEVHFYLCALGMSVLHGVVQHGSHLHRKIAAETALQARDGDWMGDVRLFRVFTHLHAVCQRGKFDGARKLRGVGHAGGWM